jgi:hypothetical protein
LTVVFCVTAWAVGGCLPSGPGDGRCNGNLGCSSNQTVGATAGQRDDDVPVPTKRPSPHAKGVNAVIAGPGCGKPLPADQPTTIPGQIDGYKVFTVMGTGATLAGPEPADVGPRRFWVRVPLDYNPGIAYRVVFIGGGYQIDDPSKVYPLFDGAKGGTEQAVYVAIDRPTDQEGYDIRSGAASREWEAFQLFMQVVDETYCVDQNRIFAVGYEPGGQLANMWGCYFAGDGRQPASDPTTPRAFAPRYHVRGRASVAVAAGAPEDDPPCNGPVAALWIHDYIDGSAPISTAWAERDDVLRRNDCADSPTAPWHPEVAGLQTCVQYTTCPKDYPVVFCRTEGLGNASQDNAAVPAFTMFFDEAAPRP